MKTLLELIADLLSCFNHCTDDGIKGDAGNSTPGSVSIAEAIAQFGVLWCIKTNNYNKYNQKCCTE